MGAVAYASAATGRASLARVERRAHRTAGPRDRRPDPAFAPELRHAPHSRAVRRPPRRLRRAGGVRPRAPAPPPAEPAPDGRALAAWACAVPDAPIRAGAREVRHGGVRFQVPAGMVQQSRSPADVYEWEYTFTRGPRRLLVRLARREAWVGPLIGAQCEVEVAGRMAEVRVRTRNSNLERYTAMLKWRGVYPGADLYVEAVAPDLEGLEELRRVFWTFQLPDWRQAERG